MRFRRFHGDHPRDLRCAQVEIQSKLYNTEIHRALSFAGFSLSISLRLASARIMSSALVGGPGGFTACEPAEGAPLPAAGRPPPPPSEERKALGDLCAHGYYSSIT